MNRLFSSAVLLDQFTPVSVFSQIKTLFPNEITFLFESVLNKDVGSFSYIMVGADEELIYRNGKTIHVDQEGRRHEVDSNPLKFLKRYYQDIDQQFYKDMSLELKVGFVGGFIGYIGYDTVQEFEPVLQPTMRDLEDRLEGVPDLYMICPKLIIAYSHRNSQVTLLTHLESMKNRFGEIRDTLRQEQGFLPMQKAELLGQGGLELSDSQFHDNILKSKEMIRQGEVFQILMSNRYRQPARVDPFSFYRMLRTKNPSPYLFLLNYPGFSIAGSSPEVMVRLQDGEILLRPIAGTRKRGKTPKRDRDMEYELVHDQKEIAEHIMLVDLGRNDVGRVAKKGTVNVAALMRVERYSHVMHLVSDVVCELDEQHDMFDLFAATFTAGTMTGAPKIRAMELIAEFEGNRRGFYSGAVGYFGFNGDMDSAITIRSSLIMPDEIIFHAGAGVVADSQPELESLEIRNKLGALIASLEELAK